MTIVVKISLKDSFILIGDSLISGDERNQEIGLPTIPNLYDIFPKGSGYSVTNLKHKVNILGNNILIAWYGNERAASVVIKELRVANEKQPLSIAQIKSHLDVNNIKDLVGAYVIGDNNPVGFTGFVIENNQITHEFESFTGNQEPGIEIPLPQKMGNIKLYGSGAQDFQEYLTQNLNQIAEKISQSQDSSELIHQLFLMISSDFLAQEICTGKTIMQYYGGLYDFAAIGNGELLKPIEHTYFFWEVVPDKDGNPDIQRVYQGIKIRSTSEGITECLSWMTEQHNQSVEIKLHYITPIEMKNANAQELIEHLHSQNNNQFNLNSEYSYHYILVQDSQDNRNYIQIPIRLSDLSKQPVKIDISNKGFHYDIHPEFKKQIKEQVLQ